LENAEMAGKTNLSIARLELRRVPRPRDGHATDGNRVIECVREDRLRARSREDIEGHYRPCRILRTYESEQIGDVGGGIADRPGAIDMIGHESISSARHFHAGCAPCEGCAAALGVSGGPPNGVT